MARERRRKINHRPGLRSRRRHHRRHRRLCLRNKMMNQPTRIFLSSIVAIAVASTASRAQQPAPAATQPTTQPTTQHANGGNGNGAPHITTAPGGGIVLNFKDASIDAVLDELSSVAGFIVVRVDKPEGRVTIESKKPV